MFKKPVDVKALQRLSGADKKKLRRTAKERFPQASDEDIDAILPSKVDITVAKYPNRVHVYGLEGGLPMLFDIDGRGTEIYPTVYALWKVPDLLPAFVLKGGEVSRYIIGGADLMFPGVSAPSDGLPSFQAGEAWSVKVPGNPAPIAVGATTMTSSEAVKAGLRGKALRITHYYRDSLWDSAEGRYVPNAGFLDDIVIPDPAALASSSQHDSSGESYEDIDEVEDDEVSPGNGDSQFAEPGATEDNDVSVEASEETSIDMSGLNLSEKMPADEPQDEKEQQRLSVDEVDALLDKCLLQALHTTVKEKDLPLPGSTLWSNHILPCRPPGITLDIKKSSHKKLSKWLQSKASLGLISAKEDKYKKEIMLLGINRHHPEYMSYKPEKIPKEVVVQQQDKVVAESSNSKQFEVAEVYKPTTHVKPIFIAVEADVEKYYSPSDASAVVFRYVEKENLVKPTDNAVVVLDVVLCDALYKGAIKKGLAYPTEIHKKDLGSTFLNRMQIHHSIVRGSEAAVRKGAIGHVQILTERRQGNKKVTRVSGLEPFLMDPESIASELQKKFACSTSLAELPGKKGQYEVLIQGGVIDDVARHLVEQYGIPKRYIEVLDKTKK